jgi:hypothetical protein
MLRMPILLRLYYETWKVCIFLCEYAHHTLIYKLRNLEKRLNNWLISSSRGRIQRKTWSVWDPMPELTITSPYVHSRVDSNTFTMGLGNPVPESTLTVCQSRLYPLAKDFGFGLRSDCMGTFSLFFFYGDLIWKFLIRLKPSDRHHWSRFCVKERSQGFVFIMKNFTWRVRQ